MRTAMDRLVQAAYFKDNVLIRHAGGKFYYDNVAIRSISLQVLTILAISFPAILLTACGGSEPGSQPETAIESTTSTVAARPVEEAPAVKDSRPTVVAFGDSLTEGLGISAGNSYPDFLQREFDRRGLQFQVVNEGVSGDTTVKAMNRMNTVLSHNPQWVILALGANDGLRGLPVGEMENNLRQMIQECLENNARVLLTGMRLPPNYGPVYIGAFEAVFPKLAKELDIAFIPFLLENVAAQRELNMPDGIHPNPKGNAIIASQVADAFESYLE